MQLCCSYKNVAENGLSRRALTLLELVVVLGILVVLSGLVVPLIEGLGYQTNASTNATVINDVNRAVRTYHARFEERYPNGWDSLVDGGGNLFSELHPALTGSSPQLLVPGTLTALQAESLGGTASITAAYVHDSTTPNSVLSTTVSLTTGAKVALLNAAFADEAFNVNHLDNFDPNQEYVVLGLGPNTSIRSAVMTDVPLISSADPSNNYARVLCVFMVPGTDSNAVPFAAKYVGCFLPDGTSLGHNLDKYNNSVADN